MSCPKSSLDGAPASNYSHTYRDALPSALQPIPNELFMYILSFLSVPSLCTLSLTCKLFKCLSNEPSLWKKLCENKELVPERGYSWKKLYVYEATKGKALLQLLPRFPSLKVVMSFRFTNARTFAVDDGKIVVLQKQKKRRDYSFEVLSSSCFDSYDCITWDNSKIPTALTLYDDCLFFGTKDGAVCRYDPNTGNYLGEACNATTYVHYRRQFMNSRPVEFYSFIVGKGRGVWLHRHELKIVELRAKKDYLAALHATGFIRLWDVYSGALLAGFYKDPLLKEEKQQVACFDFSRTTLITSHFNGEVCLWDIATGAITHTLTPKHAITSIHLDHEYLIFGKANGKVSLLDKKTLNKITSFGAHIKEISTLTKEGPVLITASDISGNIKCFDFQDPLNPICKNTLAGYFKSPFFVDQTNIFFLTGDCSLVQWHFSPLMPVNDLTT